MGAAWSGHDREAMITIGSRDAWAVHFRCIVPSLLAFEETRSARGEILIWAHLFSFGARPSLCANRRRRVRCDWRPRFCVDRPTRAERRAEQVERGFERVSHVDCARVPDNLINSIFEAQVLAQRPRPPHVYIDFEPAFDLEAAGLADCLRSCAQVLAARFMDFRQLIANSTWRSQALSPAPSLPPPPPPPLLIKTADAKSRSDSHRRYQNGRPCLSSWRLAVGRPACSVAGRKRKRRAAGKGGACCARARACEAEGVRRRSFAVD